MGSSHSKSNMVCDLPNELLLEIFPLLPLKSLIAARGVNKKWRHLTLLSDLLPARRALLDLYITVIESPYFLATRRLINSNTQPFDREEYINWLLARKCELPEEFRLWILEWPSAAVFAWTWPGIGTEFFSDHDIGRPFGRNCLGRGRRTVADICFPVAEVTDFSDIDIEDDDGGFRLHALELWEHGCAWSTWMIVDTKADLHGVVRFGEIYYVEANWIEEGMSDEPMRSSWMEWMRGRLGADVF